MRRLPNEAFCENRKCGQAVILGESLLDPDEDTPPDHIHARYDLMLSSYSFRCKYCGHFTVSISAPDSRCIKPGGRPVQETKDGSHLGR
jgi:hypothetical protein